MFDDSRFPLLGAGYLDPREAQSHAHASRAQRAREWDKALEETQRARRLQDTQQNSTDDSQASSQKPSSQSLNSAAGMPYVRGKQAYTEDDGIADCPSFLATILGPTLAYLLGLSRK